VIVRASVVIIAIDRHIVAAHRLVIAGVDRAAVAILAIRALWFLC
jgi:hypothetical protein